MYALDSPISKGYLPYFYYSVIIYFFCYSYVSFYAPCQMHRLMKKSFLVLSARKFELLCDRQNLKIIYLFILYRLSPSEKTIWFIRLLRLETNKKKFFCCQIVVFMR